MRVMHYVQSVPGSTALTSHVRGPPLDLGSLNGLKTATLEHSHRGLVRRSWAFSCARDLLLGFGASVSPGSPERTQNWKPGDEVTMEHQGRRFGYPRASVSHIQSLSGTDES